MSVDGRAPLLVALNEADVAAMDAAGAGGQLLVHDPDLHLRLLELGREHVTTWDVVGHDEREAVHALDESAWAFWREAARAPFGSVDLLQCAGFRHASWISRLVWAAYVVRRAAERLDPAAIVTTDQEVGHALDQPAESREFAAMAAVAAGVAEHLGLPVRRVSCGRERGGAAFHDEIRERTQSDLPAVNLASELTARPFVLFQANGSDLPRQLPLVRELIGDGRLAAVQVYKWAERTDLESARGLGHPVLHESQLAPPAAGIDTRGISAAARLRFEQHAVRLTDVVLRTVFANPHLRSHYEFLFGEYVQRIAAQSAAWRRWIAQCRPAAFVANYHSPLLDLMAAEGVPSLVLPHGLSVCGLRRWYESLPGGVHVATCGERHAQRLVQAGFEAQRVHVTKPSLAPAHPASRESAPAGPAGQRRILLCTGNLGIPSKFVHPPLTDWKRALASIVQLGRLAARHPQWQFAVKCHPRFDHPAVFERVNRELPPPLHWPIRSDLPLEQAAADADVVVFCNIFSSGQIELSAAGRVVLVLADALVWDDSVGSQTQYWPRLESVGALEEELARLLSDESYAASRRRQCAAAARHFFAGADARHVPSQAELILRLAGGCPAATPARPCAR